MVILVVSTELTLTLTFRAFALRQSDGEGANARNVKLRVEHKQMSWLLTVGTSICFINYWIKCPCKDMHRQNDECNFCDVPKRTTHFGVTYVLLQPFFDSIRKIPSQSTYNSIGGITLGIDQGSCLRYIYKCSLSHSRFSGGNGLCGPYPIREQYVESL